MRPIRRRETPASRPPPSSGERQNSTNWRLLKSHRMVTLTGVGGVGKTRLAFEVAAHGQRLPRRSVGHRVGRGRGSCRGTRCGRGGTRHRPTTRNELADSVAAASEGRSRLLVFDNCEHVLESAAELIEAILARSETVRMLATSREGLRVADEQLWSVPSLDTSGLDSLPQPCSSTARKRSRGASR